MAIIEKQFTKFVFPFKYVKGQLDPTLPKCRGRKGERAVFDAMSVKAEELRSGLVDMLSEGNSSAKIADCYQLDVNSRAYFNLPNRKTDFLVLHARQSSENSELRVAITDVCIYLFESGVGILEFECEYESKSIEDYIHLNYFISEPKSEKNYFISTREEFDQQAQRKTAVEYKFTVKEFIDSIIDSMWVNKEEEQSIEFFDVKPIIFSNVLLDQCPEDLELLLKHAAKNLKDSYRLSEESYPVNTYVPFDNSRWAVTMKGVVNINYITDCEGTNDFFRNAFPEKARGIYHTLFLHIVHQKYSTMHMLSKMGELDRLSMNYEVMKKELVGAYHCRSEAYNLMFRAFFQVPSEQEHINKYYEYLYRNFRINDLQNNFKNDIANLENLCDTYVKRIKERKNKIKEKKSAITEIFVAIFGTLVAEITLINSSWDILEKLYGRSVNVGSIGVVAMIAAIVLPLVTITVDVVKRTKDIIKINKDLDEEVQNGLIEKDFDKTL